MGSEGRTIFIFSTHDISTVQGTTEAYYISRSLGELYDVHIIGPFSATIEGTTSHSYTRSGLPGLIWMNIILLPRWIQLAYKSRPDIAYVYRNVILPPIILKWLFGTRIVCDFRVHPVEQPKEFNADTVQNTLFVRLAWLGHEALVRYSDVTITLSKPLRRSLADSFSVREENIRIVPLGVDPEMFVPRTEDHTEKFTLAYVGSIKPHRGVESIFEGLNELPETSQQRIAVELFGPVSDYYAAEIESLASNGTYSITWHGLIPHDAIPERVGRCDCAVSPLPPHEGFEVSSPAKIYEYLALGLPIIATKITPHQRILENEQDALLVDPGDSGQMVAAIERLLTNEDLRCRLSTHAREKGIENSWENRIESILDAISDEPTPNMPP